MKFFFAAAAVLLSGASGCVKTEYRGETFPATRNAVFYANLAAVPGHYRIIGFAKLSASARDSTSAELKSRALALGEAHGAQGVIVLGVEFVPSGYVVNAWRDLSLESAALPMNEFIDQQQWEVDSGGFGLDRTKVFRRVMYVCFLRFGPGARADASK